MLSWFGTIVPSILLANIGVVLFVIAVVIVPPNRRPSSALAWMILILVLPIIGLALFALIGSPNLPRARRDKQHAMSGLVAANTSGVDHMAHDEHTPEWLPAIALLNRNMGAMPMVDGNTATLLPHFDDQIAALVAAVDSARETVLVEFYIIALDDSTRPFFAALEAAVSRGVTVRVLLDHIGSSGYAGYAPAKRELDRIGADWRLMLPVQPWKGLYQRPDLRNHRKLMVVDSTVGFIGSLNLIEPSYEREKNRKRGLRWRDLLVEVRGPVVTEIEGVFVTDWYSETDELPTSGHLEAVGSDGNPDTFMAQITPSGPAFESENNLALFNSLLYAAGHRISITSPYFVPDESLLGAILTAARRGVDVELFVGDIGDQFVVFHAQHSYYRDLLAAGVKIYLHRAPTILHAKHISVDDDVSVVGSSNMDIRSFQLDLEVMMLVCGRGFTDALRVIEDEYRADSKLLTLANWEGRGRFHAIVDNLARLTSAVQ